MSIENEPALSNRSAQVDEFMLALDHPMKDAVQDLRLAILAANPDVAESVKWNAPNFSVKGADRVTFNLRDPDRIVVILHRGAKKDPSFDFHDASGLLVTITPDRRTVTFTSPGQATEEEARFLSLVRDWIAA